MTLPRVRFKRYETITHIDSISQGMRFETNEIGIVEGVILGVVSRKVRNTLYHVSSLGYMPDSSSEVETTFAVVGCDDGKVEEQALSALEYLTNED